jgi:DNA-directed RNA polymerase specialized sigma24 family protein
VTAATLPITTSGEASSSRISSRPVTRSMAIARGRTARYRPLVLMSSSMPDRRSVGYRLLGSLPDAEDVVQETYARWYAMPSRQRAAIESPGAWLNRVTGRICLDLLGSARARRERYVGEWIPEPLPEPSEWIGGRTDGATAD